MAIATMNCKVNKKYDVAGNVIGIGYTLNKYKILPKVMDLDSHKESMKLSSYENLFSYMNDQNLRQLMDI